MHGLKIYYKMRLRPGFASEAGVWLQTHFGVFIERGKHANVIHRLGEAK